MSNVLEDRGHDLSSDLWTARLLLEDPGEIAAVHAAYFRAGAGRRDDGELPGERAGADGRRVSSRTGPRRRSGPASRSRARCATSWPRSSDGSCWWPPRSGRTAPTSRTARSTAAGTASAPPTLRDFHAPRLELLADAGPDLLAVETIPDADEAEVLVPLHRGARAAGLVLVRRDRRDDPGRPAADRGVRRGGRLRAAGRRRRQLLGPPRRRPGRWPRPRQRHRQARRRLPEPRRALGQRRPTRGWARASSTSGSPRAGSRPAPRMVGGCCRVGPDRIADLRRAVDVSG